MSNSARSSFEILFSFASAATQSEALEIGPGAWGTIIVPTGSALIGKTLQIVAVSRHTPARFAEVTLLTTPITLVAGANALSADQIREAGAAGFCRLQVNSAVGSAASCVLLWKS